MFPLLRILKYFFWFCRGHVRFWFLCIIALHSNSPTNINNFTTPALHLRKYSKVFHLFVSRFLYAPLLVSPLERRAWSGSILINCSSWSWWYGCRLNRRGDDVNRCSNTLPAWSRLSWQDGVSGQHGACSYCTYANFKLHLSNLSIFLNFYKLLNTPVKYNYSPAAVIMHSTYPYLSLCNTLQNKNGFLSCSSVSDVSCNAHCLLVCYYMHTVVM